MPRYMACLAPWGNRREREEDKKKSTPGGVVREGGNPPPGRRWHSFSPFPYPLPHMGAGFKKTAPRGGRVSVRE
jgi:hypothetical protein